MFFFLPWERSIRYSATHRSFGLGGIHIIPNHSRSRQIEFAVPHYPGEHLYGCSWRSDHKINSLADVMIGTFEQCKSLELLVEYIVVRFQSGAFDEWYARELAMLLYTELIKIGKTFHGSGKPFPTVVRTMIDLIDNNIENPFSLINLEHAITVSKSTIIRMFKKYLHTTPNKYIIQQKMIRSCQLLSTTSLPVKEVCKKAGIDDEYYFSKVFKKEIGMTATAYRKKQSLLQ